jgi:DNA-binding FadR family transcriptional regulator
VTAAGDERVRKSGPAKKEKPTALFAPLKPKRAFEEISAEIKRMIFSGVLKPGDRLPSESELGSQFGVSRQTIREAVRRLELAGFIAIQKGASGGPLVVDTILNSISDSFLDAFRLKKMTTDELTKARLEIERMVLKNVLHVMDKACARLRGNWDRAFPHSETISSFISCWPKPLTTMCLSSWWNP